MEERTIPVKVLEDITACPICLQVYTDPRSLPCIHTFCLNCIAAWVRNNQQPNNQVVCPMCRDEFTIPIRGIEYLPKNIFIGKLLNVDDLSAKSGAEEVFCHWCKTGGKANKQAKIRCLDCRENLCDDCNNMHAKISATRSHHAVGIEEKVDATYVKCMPTMCDEHPSEELKIHCFDCQATLCMMCFMTEHSGHKSGDVNRVADDYRSQMKTSIANLSRDIGMLDASLSELVAFKGKVCDKYSDVEVEIKEMARQLVATIENHRDQLLSECEQLKNETLKEVSHDIDELTSNKNMTESLIKYCEGLLNKGSNCDITRETKSVRMRIETLAKFCRNGIATVPDTIVTFTPQSSFSSDSTNCLGRIFRGSQELRPSLTYSIPGEEQVSAVTSSVGQLFVTRGLKSENQVAVYDTTDFRLVRHISIPDATGWLYGLAVCAANKCLYVSDNTNNEVHRVNLLMSTTSVDSTATKWSVAEQPAGLSVNKSNNVLVAFFRAKKIVEYTPDWSMVREISDSNCLWHAVELNDGTLAASRNGPFHSVCLMSVAGEVLLSYGSSMRDESGAAIMNYPRTLAVDKRGNVLVADQCNNRILLMNSSLSEVRTLQLPISDAEQFRSPLAIWLDEPRGRLYVSEDGGLCRVIVYDNVFNLGAAFLSPSS